MCRCRPVKKQEHPQTRDTHQVIHHRRPHVGAETGKRVQNLSQQGVYPVKENLGQAPQRENHCQGKQLRVHPPAKEQHNRPGQRHGQHGQTQQDNRCQGQQGVHPVGALVAFVLRQGAHNGRHQDCV